jgi:hypothetical protein
MNDPDTGLQQPNPVAPPAKVPEISVRPTVAVPEADPEQGAAKYSVKVADLPLIWPAMVPPPKPGTRALKVQPTWVTITMPEPEPPQELPKEPL